MSRIAENVTRLFGRVRPTVGLRTCLATLALFSVVVWYFSPAKPSPLPPRSEVERVRAFYAGGQEIAYAGDTHIRSELSSDAIDRLYAALHGATLTNDDRPDPEDVRIALGLWIDTANDSRQVLILASREHGSRIDAYDPNEGAFGIFRMKADPASFADLQAIGEEASEIHRRSKAASN